MSARPGLCGGYQATGIPTAISLTRRFERPDPSPRRRDPAALHCLELHRAWSSFQCIDYRIIGCGQVSTVAENRARGIHVSDGEGWESRCVPIATVNHPFSPGEVHQV